MSRRHHGGRPHRANAPGRPIDTSRPLGPVTHPEHQPPAAPASEPAAETRGAIAPTVLPGERLRAAAAAFPESGGAPDRPAPAPAPSAPPDREGGEPLSRIDGADGAMPADNGIATPPTTPATPIAPDRQPGVNGARLPGGPPLGVGGACTAPQLRRFIKSRPYVPMHELRRRFGIDGGEDDVTPVDLASGRIYVGLPPREGSLLGELLRGGEVGFELSLDPRSPVVVGLYPMRPVARN
jgi:hypothetical protein